MLTVLAVHLDATKNALNVPDIYPEGTSPHLPIGAICTVGRCGAFACCFSLFANARSWRSSA